MSEAMVEPNSPRSHLFAYIIVSLLTACITTWGTIQAARQGVIEPKVHVIENSEPYKLLVENYKATVGERDQRIAQLEKVTQTLQAELVEARKSRATTREEEGRPDSMPPTPDIEREPDPRPAISRDVKPGERVQQTAQLAKSTEFDNSVRVGVYSYKTNWWPQANLTIDGKHVGWQSPGFKRLARTTQTKRCFVEYAEAPEQSALSAKAVFTFAYSCEAV